MINYSRSPKHNTIRVLSFFIVVAAMVTSSFDIFMVINLGFNIRVTQLLSLCLVTLSLLQIAYRKRVIVPLAFKWLLIWNVFILLFVPNSNFLTRGIGYAWWLLLNTLLILSVVQFFSTSSRAYSLYRFYVYSFVFVAALGILQFLLSVSGVGSYFITQWWIPGVFPRVNGFSYEPSYYATYLLIGWVLCAYMIEARSSFFTPMILKLFFLIITSAIVLSSSRMALLFMVLWFAQYPIRFVLSLIRGSLRRRLMHTGLLVMVIFLLAVIAFATLLGWGNQKLLLSGTGIFGNPSHSIFERFSRARETLQVFIQSPLVGYSLGGVAPAIARMNSISNLDWKNVKHYEGMSVFLEVLAASGLIGVIPFVMFIISTIRNSLLLARQMRQMLPEHSKTLTALTLALIFEFLILQLNQNILRPYFWMHVAVLMACYSSFRVETRLSLPHLV